MRKPSNLRKSAFSLIEIAVVILIIGIVVAAVFVGMALFDKAKLATARNLTRSAPIASTKTLSLWLESSLETSFSEDEAADGKSISNWYAFANNGVKVNATQSTSASKPTFANTINSVHAVRFDGTNDFFNLDASFLNNTDYTIFVLEKRESAKSDNYFFGDSSITTANQNLVLGYSADETITHNQGSGNSYTSRATPYSGDGNPRIFSFVADSTSGKKSYVNGMLAGQSSDTTQLSGISTVPIGKNYQGQIGEIAIFTRALSVDERQEIEKYLAKKWTVKAKVGKSCLTGAVGAVGCDVSSCGVSVTGVSTASVGLGSGSLTCNATGYSGTVSYTCDEGTFTPSGSCSCASGYSMVSGTCQPSCTVSGVAGITNGTVVNAGSGGTLSCNATGYSTANSITYNCVGGSFSVVSGSCNSCTAGYTYASGICNGPCNVSGVAGINNTSVNYTGSSTTMNCNATGYNTSDSLTYTCVGGTFAVTSGACDTCTSGYALVSGTCQSVCFATTASYQVFTSGTSYTVPSGGYCKAKVWAVGGGGAGGSANGGMTVAAFGGGAGGVAYKTWDVLAGNIITFSIGSGGIGANSGATGGSGGNTTATYSGVTIIGGGGGGGNGNAATGAGGLYSGGDGGANGGNGGDGSGGYNYGAGGGAAIGGSNGNNSSSSSGASSKCGSDVSGLFTALSASGKTYSGSIVSDDQNDPFHYGCGTKGGSYPSSRGSDASYGGGGGGGRSNSGNPGYYSRGGQGGAGFIVIKLSAS